MDVRGPGGAPARVATLAAMILGIALIISRVGLVAHELVGHGVVALGFGADIDGWRMFAFGGGWVGFDRAAPFTGIEAYLVYTGGILVELLLAGVAALSLRRRAGGPVWRLAIAAAGWTLALHAGWYLAAGTFHGFGDGWLFHHRLGGARLALVIPVALAIVAGAYLAARHLAGALRALTPALTPRRQLGLVAIALLLGIGGHAALTFGELHLRPDRTYQQAMRTAGQRAVERDLAIEVRRAEDAGRPMAPTEVTQTRRALDRRHRQLPFGAMLIAAMAVGAIAGVARSRPAEAAAAPGTRAVAVVTALAAVSVILVILLDSAAP